MEYTDDQLTQLATQYDPSPILSNIPKGSVMAPSSPNSLGMDYSSVINGGSGFAPPGGPTGGPVPGKPGLNPAQIEQMLKMASPNMTPPHFLQAPVARPQQVNIPVPNPGAMMTAPTPPHPVSPLAHILGIR